VLLDMTGHTKWKLANAIVLVVASVAISLALIPTLGLIGAALSVLFVAVTLNVLRVVEVRFLEGLSPYDRSMAKPVAAGIAAFLVGWTGTRLFDVAATPLFAVPIAAVMCAVYAGLVLAFGVSDEDRDFLRRAVGRFRRRAGGRRARGGPE
jgi:O-antigen/teichoic acid export membrane protein